MLQAILQRKPYLAWYIRDKKTLSDQSALEHILSYGDWEEVMEAEKLLGISGMKALFDKIRSKRRVNLKPRTLNYFRNYFSKYA